MKRPLTAALLATLALCAANFALAAESKSKAAPLTGTWECNSHGGSQGDTPFTLHLEQDDETVTGSVESPMGGAEISSATLKNNRLEIHIDTSDATYILTAQLKKDQLIEGEFTNGGDEKGTWEGKRVAEAKP